MFGRLASDRVKSAAVALDEGRLDDAYRVLAAGKGRPTSDVQALRARLADALLTRGQERLLSQKFAEALSDFERAAECGADPARVGQWRGRAEAALNEDRHARRQAQSADEQARVAAAVPVAIEHYRRGRLSQAADTLRQIAGIAEASSERTMIETALRLAQRRCWSGESRSSAWRPTGWPSARRTLMRCSSGGRRS
jgi:tetratricopeptide (TPR) repeat protein